MSQPHPRRHRLAAGVATLGLLAAACGQTVLVREFEVVETHDAAAAPAAEATDTATAGDAPTPGATTAPRAEGPADVAVPPSQEGDQPARTQAQPVTPVEGDDRCAEEATDVGVTRDAITWGTILPLSGPTRPLGEQTARVMQRAIDYYNTQTSDPENPELDWGCPGRPGIYGREVQLEIAAISSDSEDDALAAMRRLADVEEVFLVRDCYLQASLMGPAHDYAERSGVTTYWCFPESLPQPQLAPHTWAIGTATITDAALLAGHIVNDLDRKRIAMLYDPTYERIAEVVRRVVTNSGGEIVEEVEARAQTAVNGRRSEVIAMRQADPDGVIILDALNATYAGVAAGQLQWTPEQSGVVWGCNKCWLKFQVDVCGDSCAGMLTNTALVPFEPYDEGSQLLHDVKNEAMPNEPADVLTFGAILITSGLVNQMAAVGPNLTRERFEQHLAGLSGRPGGGLPEITTSPNDHFGANSDWLIRFTGQPWPNGFEDVSEGYVQLEEVGVDPAWVYS